jgi:hypothetical protein
VLLVVLYIEHPTAHTLNEPKKSKSQIPPPRLNALLLRRTFSYIGIFFVLLALFPPRSWKVLKPPRAWCPCHSAVPPPVRQAIGVRLNLDPFLQGATVLLVRPRQMKHEEEFFLFHPFLTALHRVAGEPREVIHRAWFAYTSTCCSPIIQYTHPVSLGLPPPSPGHPRQPMSLRLSPSYDQFTLSRQGKKWGRRIGLFALWVDPSPAAVGLAIRQDARQRPRPRASSVPRSPLWWCSVLFAGAPLSSWPSSWPKG